jgi:hypothetical protein
VSGDCVDDFSAALLTILSRGLALFLGLLLTACFGLLISLLLLLSSLGACCVGAGFALLCCLRVSFLSAGLTVFAILTILDDDCDHKFTDIPVAIASKLLGC